MSKTDEQTNITTAFISREEWEKTSNLIAEIAQTVKDNADRTSENLTPKEVCETLKFGRATFERLKNKGILPVYRIGNTKRWYCKRSEIMRLLHEGKLADL